MSEVAIQDLGRTVKAFDDRGEVWFYGKMTNEWRPRVEREHPFDSCVGDAVDESEVPLRIVERVREYV